MAGRGGARPGAGRKPKAAKLLEGKFAAGFFDEREQQTKWKKLLASDDERIVLAAAKYLTDRIYGRAPQALKLSGQVDVLKRVVSDL